MVGKTISHYTILERLGSGGMGVVYKARDLRLHRTVALKFLPPELTNDPEIKQRLLHEARTASALDHTGICTIYEIGDTDEGQTFIAMAYYEGETLKEILARGPLAFEEARDLALQIACALSQAHERGIVHRDIKPANVIITAEGTAKILDFGLAKLAGVDLTRSGNWKGTIAYMCPEAIRGQTVDQRCDLWSLGVVFYEMLTGVLPFRGEYAEPLMYSVVNEQPQPLAPDVPDSIRTVVDRLLQKAPDKRYQRALEVLEDLESLSRPGGPGPTSRPERFMARLRSHKVALAGAATVAAIALALTFGWSSIFPGRTAGHLLVVLPVVEIVDRPGQQWYADAITDALTTQLAQISGLRVISLATALQYRGTQKTPPAIAEELGVDYLVEASAARAGEQTELSVRLIDPGLDQYVWARSFQSDSTRIFLALGDVARAIAGALGTGLTPSEQKRLADLRSVHPEAYELYLKGKMHLDMMSREETQVALGYFEKALEVDSSCALAYVGLIYCYGFSTYWGWIPRAVGLERLQFAIGKALELDRNLADAYQALGATRLWQLWDWNGAGEAFERAFELNPNLAGVMGGEYVWYLMVVGRHEESIAVMERFLTLDPLSYVTRVTAFQVYYRAGQYVKAADICRRSIQLRPDDARPYHDLANVLVRQGRDDDAHQARIEAIRLSSTPSEEIERFDSLYTLLGPEAYPRWLHLQAEGQPLESKYGLVFAAWIHAGLHEPERALDCLELAYEAHDGQLVNINTDPGWDLIRQEHRFQDLVERMRFPG